MRFCIQSIRSLYRSVYHISGQELERYKLDLVSIQEVRWDKGGTVRAGNYNFFYGKGMKIINWKQDFCTTENTISSKNSRVCW